jgi:tetratricopeptide (TPR) repeat protein
MSKLTVFQGQASTGMMVTLRLTRGEDLTGRITELDDFHVCVDIGQRIVTIFDDILAGWEIHQATTDTLHQNAHDGKSTTKVLDSLSPPYETPRDTLNVATAISSRPSSVDMDVLACRARIDAAYSEGTKRAHLEPPQPDFSFSDAELPVTCVPDVRRELDRARNQYEYAIKVREESRLTNIVGQTLTPLVAKYPRSASIQAVLGCLLLKLGRTMDAIEHLRVAARVSRNPDHWHALACASVGSAIECYALRNYFLVKTPDEAQEAWLRYITVALSHSDGMGLVRVLETCLSLEVGTPPQEAAVETLIYLLGNISASDAAISATVSLIGKEALSSNAWRDLILRALGTPSEELAREQELDTLPSPSTPIVSTVPRGTIVSFGNQRFGFIEDLGGDTYFFRIDDVADSLLEQELLNGAWRRHADVEFRVLPSPGHRYHRATEVLPLMDIDALLGRAQRLVGLNQYPQAMSFVRRALSIDPDNLPARNLEKEIKSITKKSLSLGVGLPKGNGPYARAKRAHLVEENLLDAERLFRDAIHQRDHLESAVKDLAALLQQMGRNDDAVLLLVDNRKHYTGVSPYDNILATLLQQTGRHDEAGQILSGLRRETPQEVLPALLRRIAFSQFKGGNYDEAEATLHELLLAVPGDRIAERWLAGLEEARRSGSYAEAGEIIGGFSSLAEEGLDLSPLAQSAIKGCSFEGVDPVKLQTGAITTKDVDRLEELAKELGTKRPRDRAAYYLSAASILSRLSSEESAARIYDYLRRYFSSMGDAAWVAKQPADVARSYYTESLALVSEPRDESWRTLLRYLGTYVPVRLGEVEQSIQNSRKYRDTVCMLLSTIYREVPSVLYDALMEVSSLSRFASEAILAGVKTLTDVQAFLTPRFKVDGATDVSDLAQTWTVCCEQRSRARYQAYALCGTMTRHQLTAASVEDLIIQMRSQLLHFLPELDKRRLSDLLDIAEYSLRFCRATDFEEKEQYYWLATTRAKSFHNSVTEAPTRFTHAGLLPISEHLCSLIEEQYAQTARTSAAQLEVRLLVDHYVRGIHSEVKLQFEVANKQGCSPASSVHLVLGPLDSLYFEASKADFEVASTLRGGAAVVSHVTLKLHDRTANEPAFPISVRAKYLSRVGEDCWDRGFTVDG